MPPLYSQMSDWKTDHLASLLVDDRGSTTLEGLDENKLRSVPSHHQAASGDFHIHLHTLPLAKTGRDLYPMTASHTDTRASRQQQHAIEPEGKKSILQPAESQLH